MYYLCRHFAFALSLWASFNHWTVSRGRKIGGEVSRELLQSVENQRFSSMLNAKKLDSLRSNLRITAGLSFIEADHRQ